MISSKECLPWLAFIAYILSCLVLASEGQQFSGNFIANPCVNKSTCRECIQTLDCAWCSEPNLGDKPRCFDQNNHENACDSRHIHNPSSSTTVLAARELSKSNVATDGSSSFGEIVEISPQHVSMKLRRNEVHKLQISYSNAEDYPIDLYYIMDLSKTMEHDKEKLVALGELLSANMRNITSNFRLGFGSFVSAIPKDLENSCEDCSAPYGFRNHMPLGGDTSKFMSDLRRAVEDNKADRIEISGNLNASQGGFNAIMQAIACREQIGWREQARRLLVFSTNTGFHFAGDGKLHGIIPPNDGVCHLNSNGLYTHSVLQDNPSISQISHGAQRNSINVIFAVTANQLTVYEKLSDYIEGSSSAVLSNDSSNVIDLVREQYSKISSSIDMRDNAYDPIKITYHSKCLNDIEMETSRCDGIRVGDIVTFTAEIQVTSCPADPAEWQQVIQIYNVGSLGALKIDLEMLCTCDCERPDYPSYEIKSPQCNNHGTLMCGLCDCEDMYFGHWCECSTTDMHLDKINDFGCRADNTSLVDCSGRGLCLCGVCECDKRSNYDEVVSGKFCECDNFSCDRHHQQLCSGPDHGTCECGVCVCKPGWTGSACACNTSIDSCMPPNGGEICSGRGECICGKCECISSEVGRYSGSYCQNCPTCSDRCHELKDCTQCQMYGTGPLSDEKDCAANCTEFTPYEMDEIEIDEDKDEYLCIFYDELDCRFTFKYREEDNHVIVSAKMERECPLTNSFNRIFGNIF